MNIEIFTHEHSHRIGDSTTHPLARPVKRLALSLLLAYPGRLRLASRQPLA
ncbi:MAG: hypothetical protein ABL892_09910 [Thiobacillaceae bacterium]